MSGKTVGSFSKTNPPGGGFKGPDDENLAIWGVKSDESTD